MTETPQSIRDQLWIRFLGETSVIPKEKVNEVIVEVMAKLVELESQQNQDLIDQTEQILNHNEDKG